MGFLDFFKEAVYNYVDDATGGQLSQAIGDVEYKKEVNIKKKEIEEKMSNGEVTYIELEYKYDYDLCDDQLEKDAIRAFLEDQGKVFND